MALGVKRKWKKCKHGGKDYPGQPEMAYTARGSCPVVTSRGIQIMARRQWAGGLEPGRKCLLHRLRRTPEAKIGGQIALTGWIGSDSWEVNPRNPDSEMMGEMVVEIEIQQFHRAPQTEVEAPRTAWRGVRT